MSILGNCSNCGERLYSSANLNNECEVCSEICEICATPRAECVNYIESSSVCEPCFEAENEKILQRKIKLNMPCTGCGRLQGDGYSTECSGDLCKYYGSNEPFTPGF